MALLWNVPCRSGARASERWVRDGERTADYLTIMTRETDIPCAECNGELEERSVRGDEIPVGTTYRGRLDVAECPRCSARYYPERALTRLLGGSGERRAPDGTNVREYDG